MEEKKLVSKELIITTMVITVLISVFAHGLTTVLGANWYAHQMSDKQYTQARMPENKPVPEMAVCLLWRQ